MNGVAKRELLAGWVGFMLLISAGSQAGSLLGWW